MRLTHRPSSVQRWHIIGSIVMGIGVWTMHFVGMAAFRLPLAVYFEPLTTAASVLPAIFSGYIVLHVLKNEKPSGVTILCGGTLAGLGIAFMHYIGMGGMLVSATMLYQPGLFTLSILSAFIMASLALAVPRALASLQGRFETNIVTAIFMGLAISSLHYIAMAATVFLPAEETVLPLPNHALDSTLLVTSAVITSIAILTVATVTVILRSRILASEKWAKQSEHEARKLEHRFQRLVTRLPGAVYQFQLDPDGTMSMPYVSEAIRFLHGIEPSDVTNNADNLFHAIHPDDLAELLPSITESAENMAPLEL
ncbi:MHYT domain-containing protein [Marinobacter litoralis]|nr:MHYT domain-containing protein [Marinobacter litoralis]